jgi:hypothetical protein
MYFAIQDFVFGFNVQSEHVPFRAASLASLLAVHRNHIKRIK